MRSFKSTPYSRNNKIQIEPKMNQLQYKNQVKFLILCLAALSIEAIKNIETAPSSCDVVRCAFGAQCVVVDGRAKCECPKAKCTKIYQPICGSDNKTYGNSCLFNAAQCRSSGAIRKQFDGECNSDNETNNNNSTSRASSEPPSTSDEIISTSSVATSPPIIKPSRKPSRCGKICVEQASCYDMNGEDCDQPAKEHKCKCPTKVVSQDCDSILCTTEIRKVCGTDGKTYNNECELKRANCANGNENPLKVAHTGECQTQSSRRGLCSKICNKFDQTRCSKQQIRQGNTEGCKTSEDEQLAVACQCKNDDTSDEPSKDCDLVCTAQVEPVCGSDGQTYSNICQLNLAACQKGIKLEKVHDGNCGIVKPGTQPNCRKLCDRLATLITQCNSNEDPEFSELARCRSPKVIMAAKRCNCPLAEKPRLKGRCTRICPLYINYVCGSDGISYQNECLLSVATCDRGIVKLHNSRCVDGPKDVESSQRV